jgi:hypothetical protein
LVVLGIPLSFAQRHRTVVGGARQRAVQLYPRIAPQLARKADANRADALLMADFGRRGLLKEPAEQAVGLVAAQ